MRLMRTLLASVALVGAAHAAEITVYKQPNFTGEGLTLRGTSSNLANQGFHDQISSIVVGSGRWQVCTQPDFNGDCAELGPGQYPALEKRLNHRIESIRELPVLADNKHYGNTYYYDRGYERRYEDRSDDRSYGDRRYRRDAAVELFDAPRFRGESRRVNRDIDWLRDRGFDERASSLIVNEGRWELCSEADYRGVCRIYEPGEYANLGRLNNQVGSLRRIG